MKGLPEKALRIYVGLAVAEVLCASAFIVELNRARSGNTLSWAYVFEWPILGLYAIYMWRKLLHPDDERPSPTPPSTHEVHALDAYNRYLDDVHRDDLDSPTGE